MTKYYCTKCERHHYRGKIYQKHLAFKKKEKRKKPKPDSGKIMDFDIDELRPIAKRQVKILLRKMKHTNKKDLYKTEINKLIMHENQNY